MKRILLLTTLLLGFNMLMFSQISVTVNWDNTSLTYTGNPQTPTATATNAGTNIPLIINGEETNAGTGYIATAALADPTPGVTLINATTEYNIMPATVPVMWENTSLTYDGSPQAPTATAKGVKNENLPLNVSGAQTNVGTGYTATAELIPTNSNYILSYSSTLFYIAPMVKDLFTVAPSSLQFAANGDNQDIIIMINDPNNYIAIFSLNFYNDRSGWLSFTSIVGNAYTYTYTYTAAANTTGTVLTGNIHVWLSESASSTYNTANGYEIEVTQASTGGGDPNTYTVAWSNTSLTYTGNPQTPTATATNSLNQNIAVTVSGAQTNIGTGYIATAAADLPPGITLINETTEYNITPATVPVMWENTSLTYDGSLQAPTATAIGVKGENLPLDVSGAQKDVGGPYNATAALNPANNNYTLNNTSTTFTIVPATVAVTDVKLNKTSTTLAVGGTETLTPTIAPTNATNKNVTWSSSNTAVATVSATGVVTAVSAGTATITVTTQDGNKTATCTVTVPPPPPGSPVPVFSGLADEYTAGSAAVTLKVTGEGSVALTVFKVNNVVTPTFNPAAAGTYLIEASSPDGKLKIWKYVKVKN